MASTAEERIPKTFEKAFRQLVVEGVANGIWLGTLEIRGQRRGQKVRLSDTATTTDLYDRLKEMIDNCEIDTEWEDVMPRRAIEWFKSYPVDLAGSFDQAVNDAANRAVTSALSQGLSEAETATLIRQSTAQLTRVATSRLNAIARTESTRAFNAGRLVSFTEDSGGYVVGVEFSAVLDSPTTDICRERDGLRMRLDSPILAANTPPLHVNCRSVLIPVTLDEATETMPDDARWSIAPRAQNRESDIDVYERILYAPYT